MDGVEYSEKDKNFYFSVSSWHPVLLKIILLLRLIHFIYRNFYKYYAYWYFFVSFFCFLNVM